MPAVSGPSLFSAFEQVAKRQPDHIAFKAESGRGKQYTYRDVREMAAGLARGLSDARVPDRVEVGLLSENRPEWGIAYLGILAAGMTVVPIDANLKESEIAHIIRHANLELMFASERFEPPLIQMQPEIQIFSFDEDSANNWLCLMNGKGQAELSQAADVAVLIYTSGTTGDPKAVELTHKNILANLEGIAPILSLDPSDVCLSVLPLHHTLEATCGFLTPLLSGASIVYARSLKSKDILEDIAHNRVTLMCGVPLLYEKMYHSMRRGISSAPLARRIVFRLLYSLAAFGWRLGIRVGKPLFAGLRSRAGLGSMRGFVSGGAALPPRIARFFNLIGFDFLEGYGLTECAPVVTVNRPDDIRFGSVGPPLKNVEVTIHSPDERGVGEIIVRGDNVTPGYRNNPEETAELLKNGWLYTGDLGQIKDGRLWITGRKKNLIVSAAGKNIYPEQIEEKLLESKYVLESVVFGRRKKGKQGEEVRAIVVPDMEQLKADFRLATQNPEMRRVKEILADEIRGINTRMADYKRISGFDVQLEELEKTSTKKVKRFMYQ